MDVRLRVNHADYFKESELSILVQIIGLHRTMIKITTNNLNIEYDKKDASKIRTLKNIKFVYKLEEGCLLLIGNLGCTYRDGFNGEFYVRKIVIEPNTVFDDMVGVIAYVDFSNPLYAIDNSSLQDVMSSLIEEPNLVYNISQFDEFMDLFQYYQKLSNELSNNVSYMISKISRPYCFMPIEVKEFNMDYDSEVYNNLDVKIGYKFEEYKYNMLPNELKDKTRILVDIEFNSEDDSLKKLRSIGLDNIYLSNIQKIAEKDIPNMVQVQVINLIKVKDKIIISGELKNPDETNYEYINLYDMGQKIKVDSIDNSLKLINQGASGAASELLRYLIGDDDMPSNNHMFDSTKEKYMDGLNESQRKAFLMCTDGAPVSLIKGPPGTGKTHVINAIVEYITKELNEKVIVSSQTHVAIDNVLDKLMCNYDAIIPNRITNRKNKYSESNIDYTLYKTWGADFEKHNKRAKNTSLANAVEASMKLFNGSSRFTFSEETNKNDYMVIGATTTTSAIAGKKGLEVLKGYNWLIIDEVSKCPITEVLRYLPYVEKIIMVGDDYQLAPLLEFSKEDVEKLPSYDSDKFEKLKAMYENSVFAKTLKKAEKCGRVVQLNENYRSVKDVLQLYNVFYDNSLIERRSEVNESKVQLNSQILSNDKDIFFVEVRNGKEANDGTSRYNLEELEATKEILKELIETTIHPEKVTVAAIFPYAAQISRFQKECLGLINEARTLFKSFEYDTVDAFQGKEADIVLCNTVVADLSRKNFLNDFRRINVSMSRAKDKLILFGNSIILSKIEMSISNGPKRKFFKDIIEYINYNGCKIEYNGGFVYENTSKNAIKFA